MPASDFQSSNQPRWRQTRVIEPRLVRLSPVNCVISVMILVGWQLSVSVLPPPSCTAPDDIVPPSATDSLVPVDHRELASHQTNNAFSPVEIQNEKNLGWFCSVSF